MNQIHTLLTHESPDLDAMMSVLLIRKFGEPFFPGASTADIKFVPAGKLPDGKTPEELEAEGILCLDLGGGRFDTHPVPGKSNKDKENRSATDLVGEFLGVIQDEDWAPLIEYTRLQDTQGHSLLSKEYIHHLVSIHTILLGLEIMHKGDSEKKLRLGISILEHIPAYMSHKDKQFNYQELLGQIIERYMYENPPREGVPERAYNNFNKWYQRLQLKPKEAFSNHEMDIFVSLKAIAIGAFYNFEKDREKVYELITLCLNAIIAREEQWALALKEFKLNAVTKRIHKAALTYISSPNGMVIKAARYRSCGDLIFYRDPDNGATSILKKHQGILADFSLSELAAKVRIAEAVENGEEVDYDELDQVGTINGWFLHQSQNLLIKGSPKASDFEASKISLEHLAEMGYHQLNDHFEMPMKYIRNYIEYQKYLLRKKFQKF